MTKIFVDTFEAYGYPQKAVFDPPRPPKYRVVIWRDGEAIMEFGADTAETITKMLKQAVVI